MLLVPADIRSMEKMLSLARDYLHRGEAGRDERHNPSPERSCSMLRKGRLSTTEVACQEEKQSSPLEPRKRSPADKGHTTTRK